MSALMSAPMAEVPAESAMVCMPFQTRSKTFDRYKHKQSIRLGMTQIIIGILCMIFNSVCLGVSDYSGLGAVGHGYWCGILVSNLIHMAVTINNWLTKALPFLSDVFIHTQN